MAFLLYQELIGRLDRDLKYAIEVEGKMKLDDITNYDEVRRTPEQPPTTTRPAPLITLFEGQGIC